MILFFLFSFVFSAQPPPQPIEGVLAVVGSSVVLQTDFVQQVQVEAKKNNLSPVESPVGYNRLAERVLENIINQYVLLEHAKRDSTLLVSAEEVSLALDSQINNFISQVGSVQELERIFDKPLRSIRSDYWEEIENVLYIDRLRYKLFGGVDVSRKEVLEFFNTHRDSLPLMPASASVSVVHLPLLPGEETRLRVLEQSKNIVKNILSGVLSFEAAVGDFSEDLGSVGSGGDLGFTLRGSLFEEYESVAYNLPVGGVGGPVETSAGFHIIKLLNRVGEKIHTKHILLTVSPSDDDFSSSVEKIKGVFSNYGSRPEAFDSLALEYRSLYKNSFSGVFNNVYYKEVFPEDLASLVEGSLEFSVIEPQALGVGGFCVISVSEKSGGGKLSPESSWLVLYEMAKNYKIDLFFGAWIKEAKKSVYIKIFQES